MRQAMRLLLVGTAIVGARNPTTRATCVELDKSVHEGKGKCKPGKGIFCNARNCWAKKECALCEP